jgi:hypothetical protein
MEFAAVEGATESGEEATAEDLSQRAHLEEKAGTGRDPGGPVGTEGEAGDKAVEVDMLLKVLSPRVQDGGEADRAAAVPRVAGEA